MWCKLLWIIFLKRDTIQNESITVTKQNMPTEQMNIFHDHTSSPFISRHSKFIVNIIGNVVCVFVTDGNSNNISIILI